VALLTSTPRPQLPGHAATRRWLVTLAATVLSTYALDAAATVAGLLLAASQILHGLDHGVVLLFLAGTYVAWGAGLRVNLRANWTLLEETGTSTNVLSKAAYDVVKLRSGSVRTRRIAADAAYVLTELAKETPYYAGAFGAALLTDTISANDALIFLGGANLGAAAYEYGLAQAVRAILPRTHAPAYASFEADWVPREYLADYYSRIEPDERRTIAFFVEAMRDCAAGEPILLFGVGPTLHHVFLAAGRASEIHLGDYLPANLREIEDWIARDPRAHDWRPFVRYTLECEGIACPTEAEIAQREELTRAKVTRLLEVDVRRADPLRGAETPAYGTVISAYCVDSATGDRGAWETYMKRVAGLVRPGGTLFVAALRRSRGYVVGGKTFPSPDVDEADLRSALALSCRPEDIAIEVCEMPGAGSKGYSSIVLAHGRRRRDAGRPPAGVTGVTPARKSPLIHDPIPIESRARVN
jgi:NNMT/PNMT/TEMT family